MRKITTWRPDTCDCVLHYEWDTETTEDNRVHTPVEIFKDNTGAFRRPERCKEHAGIVGDHHEHFKHVHAENTTKNILLGHIIDNHPRLVEERQAHGGVTKHLKPHIEFGFHFTGKDHDRTLHVQLHGETLTDDERASIAEHAKTLAKPVVIL